MINLKKCPCGKTPTKLIVEPQESTCGKWGYVSGDCCGEWMIEFRLDYHEYDSIEATERAMLSWNCAPREIIGE